MERLTCPKCGELFTPNNKQPQLYCDIICQRNAAKQRHNKTRRAKLKAAKESA